MAEKTNSLYIIDASFILASLFPDETRKEADNMIEMHITGQITLAAPTILPFEVANALSTAVLRKRITKQKAQILLEEFIKLNITFENIDILKTFELAGEYNLTTYDASYLYLAETKTSSLLTFDKKLKQLAPK